MLRVRLYPAIVAHNAVFARDVGATALLPQTLDQLRACFVLPVRA